MEKKVTVHWEGEGLEFTGMSLDGTQVKMDGNSVKHPSPMAMLLHSLAACAGIDVVHILNTMRQPPEKVWVEVLARREEGGGARKWEAIQMDFHVSGQVEEAKAHRAVELSVEKYCSVYRQLACGCEISTSLTMNA